jgi:hypothetical protein
MFAHFTGDMREDIALTREIHPEHRPRQNLRHRTFGDDLFFFRHGAANISDRANGSTSRQLNRGDAQRNYSTTASKRPRTRVTK